MNIEKVQNGSELKVSISGKINTKTAPELEASLNESLDGVTSLILDLSETEYISSAGLRVLLMNQQKMDEQGSMWIEGANQTVLDIFKVTGFQKFLHIR